MTQDERMLAIHKEIGFIYYKQFDHFWFIAPCHGGVAVDGGPDEAKSFSLSVASGCYIAQVSLEAGTSFVRDYIAAFEKHLGSGNGPSLEDIRQSLDILPP